MSKEEKRRIKEEKRLAKKRAKEAKRAEKIKAKEERRAARDARKNGGKAKAQSSAKSKAKPIQAASSRGRAAKDTAVSKDYDESEAAFYDDDESDDDRKRPRNYHVASREDGKWQVKFAKGERALKLFDTQAEAIAFAKEKAENQHGSITIHKRDGKIRKLRY